MLLAVAISIVFYYVFGGAAMLCLLVSAVLLIYAMLNRGYWTTASLTSSVQSAWKYTSPIWLCTV